MAWSTAGLLAAVALPWYALQEGLDSGAWLTGLWSSEDYASGLAQFVEHNRWWLAPVLVALAACLVTCLIPVSRERRGTWLVIASATGVVLFIAQGLTVGLHGW
ncbi:MAG: iron(III) transport system permease protein, partial [Rhodospirillaceae bacterium]|nr:iron(III) transport system permease protein [Rhodospirillaceae bacterium]